MGVNLRISYILIIIWMINDGRAFFWNGKTSHDIDLTQSEVYEHPLSAAKSKQSDSHTSNRHRRQAYPVFSSTGAQGGMTIEQQRDSGPWGQWVVDKACSRTCGGGVLIEKRDCQGDPSTCSGPPKRYVSCETDPCPEGAQDFRNEQCAKFNDKDLEGKYYKWKAYNKGSNKCELLCIPEGESFYYKWSDKVIDGTKCDQMTDDICVEGFCLPLGCDNRLGSTKKQDKCLVCGGDNTGCKTMQGLHDEKQLEVGYHDIITIPIGATSILIQERKPTNNYLTMRNETGFYFLNGYWRIDFPQTLQVAGTFFEYERTRQNGLSFEKLSAKGPLTEPIVVGILHQTENTGIQYEYSLKLDENVPHIYVANEWTPCSVTCGKGLQTRTVTCSESLTKRPVAEDLCVNASLPDLNRTCTTEDCESEWFTGEWEECSSTCGAEGQQYRVSFCHQVRADGTRLTVDDAKCLAHSERPPVKRSCNRFACPEWNAGPWSSCSKPCGDAEQYRSITCLSQKEAEEGQLLADKACNATGKPEDRRECNLGPCEGLRWVTSEWTLCDRCNDTTENRNVSCQDPSGRPYPDDKCPGQRPLDTRDCATQPPCIYKWHSSQWSECSTVCGHGHQTRGVVCTYEYQRKLHIYDESHCDPALKMDDRQNCTNEAKCAGTYFTTQWTKCSAECDGGTQTRSVVCLDYDFKVRTEMCDEMIKPAESQDCNTEPCIPCDNTTFGCCPDGVKSATGPYLDGCSNCSIAEFGCCLDNMTAASGPNLENCDGEIGSGFPLENVTRMANVSKPNCMDTMFGCCPDGVTVAEGLDAEGCICNYTSPDGMSIQIPCVNITVNITFGNDTMDMNGTDANETQIHCSKTEFGCCPDWYSPAAGANYLDCPAIEIGACNDTKFGCCPDGLTLARGRDFAGCGDVKCAASRFGCCKDRQSIAFGPHFKGCERATLNCEASQHGCCPDGNTAALGPRGQGCEEDCRMTKFGCCPDGKTIAKGPSNQGCGCIYSQFGCCPDGVNSAQGPGYYGCPQTCAQSHYGCCPDGKTEARGPQFAGCPCRYTQFGCCPDGDTSALGPNQEGCDDCRYARHGCCQDGVSKATGPNYQGCFPPTTPYQPPHPPTHPPTPAEPKSIAACTQPSDIGEVCGQYQLKYFYDTEGQCRPFWYGGCGGNANRFDTEDECRATCIEPTGDGICYLPKMAGPEQCGQQVLIRYYYDISALQCMPFYYYGCNGNLNNFNDYQECMNRCQHVTDRPWETSTEDPRQRSTDHYTDYTHRTPDYWATATTDYVDHRTHPYTHGHGQTDRPTQHPDVDVCQLPADSGPCRQFVSTWYYDRVTRQCTHFFYGGCDGNQNRFNSKEECDHRCGQSIYEVVTLDPTHETIDENACDYPLDRGDPRCRGRIESHYFEKAVGQCMLFEYTGCGGNPNRFRTQEQCEAKCARKDTTDLLGDACSYPKDTGPCDNYVAMWFYNATDGTCGRFYYGGCHGNPNRFDSLHECTRQCAERVDPCTLPVVRGPCNSNETRFYWDQHSRTCREFLFGGCMGNTNKFRTHQQCLQRCDVDGGRHPIPRPAVIASSFDPHLSQSPHQGSALQNVVHPEFESVCTLAQDVGPCRTFAKKFHYDSTRRQCVEFNYGGCRGNRNRFDTLEECQSICESSRTRQGNENQEHSPLGSVSSHDTHLSLPTPTAASSGRHDDICSLPSDSGPCTHDQQTRWYFDVTRGECRQFTYGGCVGNHNNFPTEEGCRAYCARHSKPYSGGLEKPDPNRPHLETQHTTPVPDYPTTVMATPRRQFTKAYSPPLVPIANPTSTLPELCRQQMDAGTCYDSQVQFYYDWDKGKCASYSYTGCGGNTNRFQSEETCERACGKYRDQDVCSLPYDEGPCTSNLLKWRFDPDTGKCVKFAYGGCDGNGNRFSSKEECESLCRQETKSLVGSNPCDQPKEAGPCRAAIDRWAFNKASGKCELFIYGGCRGNDNNFPSRETCERRCITGRKTHSHTASVLIDDVCSLTRDAGPCNDLVSQWYYDRHSGECKLFTYGGCRGNGNRFNDRNECESRCKNQLPSARLTITEPPSPIMTTQKPPVVQMIGMRMGKSHGILLHCHTASAGKTGADSGVTWFKDGQLVNESVDGRVEVMANGSLKFTTLESTDAGGYTCSLKASAGTVSMPLSLQVQSSSDGGILARPNCTQDLGITDCKKVVISGLCRHKYYGPACCHSCAKSAMDKRAAAAAGGRRRLRLR